MMGPSLLPTSGGVDPALEARVAALEAAEIGDLSELLSEVEALDGAVATANGAIEAIDGRITALEEAPAGGVAIAIDVREYGAVGDGTTDDTEALQDAFDAAAAALASGAAAAASVYIPAGLYLSDPVYANFSNVTVFGDGRGASVLKRKAAVLTNGDSVGVLNFHGVTESRLSSVTVRDLGADGNKANLTIGSGGDVFDVECFSFVYVDEPMVVRCLARNATSEGFDFDYCRNGEVVDSIGIDCGGNAVHFSTGCEGMRGRGCRAVGCGSARDRGGFDVHTAVVNCGYTDCHATGCHRSFVLKGTGGDLVGCTALASTHTGIRVEGNQNQVTGCRVENTLNGGNGLTITGSRNSVSGGAYVGNAGHGITGVSGATNNAVLGVVCSGNGANGVFWNTGSSKNSTTGCQMMNNPSGNYADSGTSNVSTGNVLN